MDLRGGKIAWNSKQFCGEKNLKETFWVVSQSSDEYHNERKWRQTLQNRVIKNPDESTLLSLCYCSLRKESMRFREGGVLEILLWGLRSHLEWHGKSMCKTSRYQTEKQERHPSNDGFQSTLFSPGEQLCVWNKILSVATWQLSLLDLCREAKI